MSTSLPIRLTDDELNKVDTLVNFFQTRSISTVTRNDVIRFFINQAYDFALNGDVETIVKFYNAMGLKITQETVITFREQQGNA
ncbi:hypothetical protein ACYSTM_21450 [Bacillus licheniformis]|uniref:hypothetical protein n=1 Tax=Bacillus licheniformis TaxID=1402 RepID=UPI00119DAB70|nr:hypothetical protein [Bacillus licheniformis]